MKKNLFIFLVLFFVITTYSEPVKTSYPIMFVTQTPVAGFTSVTQTFSNHNAWIDYAPRGGDLMIRYPDGTIRNLTKEAGFGEQGEMQGDKSIAVRQPCVHWSGKKALFSMVIGAPNKIWDVTNQLWQIYEITGFGVGETIQIRKIENQPAEYNNISPIYGSDDKIIFTTDMPFNKKKHLYPQLDEYENARVVSGLWSLNEQSGEIKLLQHSPSGSFYPIVDSWGRIIFTRWDHLQRDQQADADRKNPNTYGTFNWSGEEENATAENNTIEVFPEPRDQIDPDYNPLYSEHAFNQFFPWEINQDGTEEETVNHIGRQEFGGTYTDKSFVQDKNLNYVIPKSYIKNKVYLGGDGGMFQIKEDPMNKGIFYAANAREFSSESAGQIIKFTGALGMNPEDMEIFEITHRVTSSSTEEGSQPNVNHSGHYRNPLPLSDGKLIVSHTTSRFANKNERNSKSPKYRYNFRLKTLKEITIDSKTYFEAGELLNEPIVRATKYYNGNDYIVERTDTLWELDAVEVRESVTPPLKLSEKLSPIEQSVFNEEGVDVVKFTKWMKDNNVALMVSRNVTTRDRSDNTQPYNLYVPEGVSTIGSEGTKYDVKFLQIFQADMLRGQGGTKNPRPGRRVLARPLHETGLKNPVMDSPPNGSFMLGQDGSAACFVPAQRAITWQLISSQHTPVVRERYWITFQPGEIRLCTSCHGLNKSDQAGNSIPQNKPEALRSLLNYWKHVATNIEKNEQQNPSLVEITPNPASGNTEITVTTPKSGFVNLKIIDILGKEIKSLMNEKKEQGVFKIKTDLSSFAKGEYLVVLTIGEEIITHKLVISR